MAGLVGSDKIGEDSENLLDEFLGSPIRRGETGYWRPLQEPPLEKVIGQ